jgi:uncharacterized protein (TIGR00299 family) protein
VSQQQPPKGREPTHSHEHSHEHTHEGHEHAHVHPHGHSHEHSHAHGHDHAHPHTHADDHVHAHAHAHAHVDGHAHAHDEAGQGGSLRRGRVTLLEGDPEAHREPLQHRAGSGKTLFFDLFSGIAGDMTLAALVDLGVPAHVVQAAVARLALPGVRVTFRRARTGALGATHVTVEADAEQPDRRFGTIRVLIERSELSDTEKALALRIFQRLARAEARVHRVPLDEVEFHEVGSVDSIVDIVGTAACLDFLSARVIASPVPLGRGSVYTAHGKLPLPAPATLECLEGVPTFEADLDAELITPTGAAIIGSMAESFVRWPPLTPERVGWGAGTMAFADRPNALRVVLGSANPRHGGSDLVVLEANLDDMTGELVGHVIALLLEAGALDAWAAPITMKKGRPGLVLSALVRVATADELSTLMLRETTSIGVRRTPADRTERPRRSVQLETRFGLLPLKVSEGPYGPVQVKPEFDACVRAAEAHGVPVRVVLAAVLAAWAAHAASTDG